MSSAEHLPLPAGRARTPLQPWDMVINTLGALESVLTHYQYDSLTSLHTKESFKDELNNKIEQRLPFGLIFMDLDAFKAINDTFGHNEGDRVLKDFGGHLLQAFKRPDDLVAHEKIAQVAQTNTSERLASRLGGDEFGIIFSLTNRTNRRKNDPPEVIMENEVKYIKGVVAAFVAGQPPYIRKTDFDVAVGSALWLPSEDLTATELLEQADKDMYANKQTRRS